MLNRLTFSLASLILIFALAFVAMPVMAATGGPTVTITEYSGKDNPNSTTGVNYVKTRTDYRLKFEFNKLVSGSIVESNITVRTAPAAGGLLTTPTNNGFSNSDITKVTTGAGANKVWVVAFNLDAIDGDYSEAYLSIALAADVVFGAAAGDPTENLGNQPGSAAFQSLPKSTSYTLTASEDATDKATIVVTGADTGKIAASDTFKVKFTATGSTGAFPTNIPAAQIQIKNANGAIVTGISAADTGVSVGGVFTSNITAGGTPVATPIFIGVNPNWANAMPVGGLRIPEGAPTPPSVTVPPTAEITISEHNATDRTFRIQVTFAPGERVDGSPANVTPGADFHTMVVKGTDSRNNAVSFTEVDAQKVENSYTGILEYNRLSEVPLTIKLRSGGTDASPVYYKDTSDPTDDATGTVGAAGVPAKPAPPTATTNANNDRRIDVSWTAPADNGSAITAYRVKKYNSAGTLVKTFPDDDPNTTAITATSYTVGPVPTADRGKSFTFEVAAMNANGWGPDSDKSAAYTVPSNTVAVDIPDPGLRAAISQALSKAPGATITRADMETLVQLFATGRGITDLRGIEFAVNLTSLNIGSNPLTDISPLSTLTNLTSLNIGDSPLTDISPLSTLTNLTDLHLTSSPLTDISPLSTLTSLTRLRLSSNRISDISPLSTLTSLTRLHIGFNRFSDISPLSTLTNLTWLYLSSNRISDISPLSTLTNLADLYLDNNSVSDISSLSSLTSLTRLVIRDNNITDVETLERLMAQGTVVYFRGNPAFESPGPKIEEGWVWLIVPATGVNSGSQAAGSGRDFLSEASGRAVTETGVARNGARAGTRVGNSMWTTATLDATDPNNLNTIAGDDHATPAVSIDAEIRPELEDYGWPSDGLNGTEIEGNTLMPDLPDPTLETHIDYPVAYGVVPIQSETRQQTRVYIGAGPVKVWLNGALVHRDTSDWVGLNYATAVPVTLNAGNNLLFIAAYRPSPSSRWVAFFGFQDGTEYTVGVPSPGNLDVNRDGRVDVLDLVLVAVFYGTRGNGLPADVNADGVVNVHDFAAVAAGVDAANALALQAIEEVLLAAIAQAGDLEKAAEAPMRFNTPTEVLSLSIAYENVTEAFIETKRVAVTDVRLAETVALLETLLVLLAEMGAIPETTALLPNYPNPFNPETWIPYHLSKGTEVILTIHDVHGVLVRALPLGHQAAGTYESRARAAHWDGRNQLGEPVASGLYFYTLTAGDFTATRKLLIIK